MGAKSLAVAQYILDRQTGKGDTMTQMQLIKLAYIAHGMTLGLLGRVLLDENVEAWPYGPVVRSIYNSVSRYGSRPVVDVHGVSDNYINLLTEEDKMILDSVCDNYGNMPAFMLSAITHKDGTPWDITMKEVGGYYPAISDNLIEQFYKSHVVGKVHDRL